MCDELFPGWDKLIETRDELCTNSSGVTMVITPINLPQAGDGISIGPHRVVAPEPVFELMPACGLDGTLLPAATTAQLQGTVPI